MSNTKTIPGLAHGMPSDPPPIKCPSCEAVGDWAVAPVQHEPGEPWELVCDCDTCGHTWYQDPPREFHLAAFKQRACALPSWAPGYQAPGPEDVRDLLNLAGWSQVQTARLAGVSYKTGRGSTTLRKWKAPRDKKEYRPIAYGTWRLLLIYAGVVDPLDDLGRLVNA